MNILLLPDKQRWAYEAIAKALHKYNHNKNVHIKIIPIKRNVELIKKKYKKYDRILVMGWQNYELVKFLPRSITSVGLHSFHSWDDKKTTIEKDIAPPKKMIKFLKTFHSVNAVSLRLTNLFQNHGINVTYTPNGVDTEIFRCIKKPPLGKKLIVGYSGSQSHDWRKGVSKFIIPAAKRAKVEVKLAMRNTKGYVPLDKMYEFYNTIDCYICASISEGMSLSVIEAASCGRPIIGTRCSGNTEIINEGMNGFFVKRSVKSIATRIEQFKDREFLQKMSQQTIKDTKKRLCWSKQVKSWINFLSE